MMDDYESVDEMSNRIDREAHFSIVSSGTNRLKQALCVRQGIVWHHTIWDPIECPANRRSPSAPGQCEWGRMGPEQHLESAGGRLRDIMAF